MTNLVSFPLDVDYNGDIIASLEFDVTTLSNGKRVVNFSSPHEFVFEDGSILPAVSNEKAEELKIDFIEEEFANGDIKLTFKLTDAIEEMIDLFLLARECYDVIFVPLPMLVAMREADYDVDNLPFRSIRITDRINKLASISKQCL